MRFAHIVLAVLPAAFIAPMALAQTPTLSVEQSDEHGPHVVGPDGRPVYIFLTNVSGGDGQLPLESCNAPCREDRPLLTVDGDVSVGDGLDPSLAAVLGWEGETVAVYDSNALWQYVEDSADMAPQGHAVSNYGGWWVLIAPSGEAIRSGIVPEPNE